MISLDLRTQNGLLKLWQVIRLLNRVIRVTKLKLKLKHSMNSSARTLENSAKTKQWISSESSDRSNLFHQVLMISFGSGNPLRRESEETLRTCNRTISWRYGSASASNSKARESCLTVWSREHQGKQQKYSQQPRRLKL